MLKTLLPSLLALAAGPLLARLARRGSRAIELIDGFVVVSVAGIVVLHVLPETAASAGILGLAAAALGFLAPGLGERFGRHSVHPPQWALGLAVSALAVHAFLDGTAMAPDPSGAAARPLVLALVLHRLPEGLAVWWLVEPERGPRAAWAALVGLGTATSLGAWMASGSVPTFLASGALGYVQAFVAGALLHVLTHHAPPAASWAHHHDHADLRAGIPSAHSRAHVPAGIGALLAIAVLLGVRDEGPAPSERALAELARDAAPALLAAVLLTAMLRRLLGESTLAALRASGSPRWRALTLAPFLALCACGVAPLARRLRALDVDPRAVRLLLVAAPVLGLDAWIATVWLLGPALWLTGTAVAALAALAASHVALPPEAASSDPRVPPLEPAPAPAPTFLEALSDAFDLEAPGWLLAVPAGALIATALDPTTLVGVPVAVQIAVAVAFVTAVELPAVGAVVAGVAMLERGFHPAVALAFAQPLLGLRASLRHGLSHPTDAGLSRAVLVGSAMRVAALVIVAPALGPAGARVHARWHDPSRPAASLVLGLMGLLLAAAFLRSGPRHAISQLLGGDDHDHADEDDAPAG